MMFCSVFFDVLRIDWFNVRPKDTLIKTNWKKQWHSKIDPSVHPLLTKTRKQMHVSDTCIRADVWNVPSRKYSRQTGKDSRNNFQLLSYILTRANYQENFVRHRVWFTLTCKSARVLYNWERSEPESVSVISGHPCKHEEANWFNSCIPLAQSFTISLAEWGDRKKSACIMVHLGLWACACARLDNRQPAGYWPLSSSEPTVLRVACSVWLHRQEELHLLFGFSSATELGAVYLSTKLAHTQGTFRPGRGCLYFVIWILRRIQRRFCFSTVVFLFFNFNWHFLCTLDSDFLYA